MKKLHYSLIAAAAIAMTACSSDEPAVNGGNGYQDGEVLFTVEMPAGMNTRAISDGTLANDLHYVVFDAADNTPLFYKVAPNAFNGTKKATLKIPLVNGKSYNIAFVAMNENAPYTIDKDNGVLNMNYSTIDLANDDERDAFYKLHTVTVANGMDEQEVTLTRPFAQVNVGALDWQDACDAGYVVEKTTLTFSEEVYPQLNLLDGQAQGTPVAVEYALNTLPDATLDGNGKVTDAATLTVAGNPYDHVAMAYLLMNDASQIVTTVNFNYVGPDQNYTIPVTQVPVQRNHRTNIVGRFFTTEVDYNIIIDERFDNPDHVVDLVPVVPDVVINAGANAQQELNDVLGAVGSTEEIIIGLPEGNFTLPGTLNGDVTFVGQPPVAGVYPTVVKMVNEVKTAQHVSFASIKMERGTEDYKGFQHTVTESYTDCEITGTLRTYAGKAEFKNCVFNCPTDKYGLHVYGAPATVLIENCEFHTDRKAVLVYTDQISQVDITVNNCKFYRDIPTSKNIDKCAISCHTELGTFGTLTINKSTATDFASFNGGLWRDVNNNQTGTPTDNFLVTVDGVKIAAADKQ